MFLLLALLPHLLPSLVSPKNILVTTPWTGHHFSLPLELSKVLATEGGHNVTFLALLPDHITHPIPEPVNYVTPTNISEDIRSLEYLEGVAVSSGALDCPSAKMISRSVVGNSVILDEMLKQIRIRFDYYFSPEMEELLNGTSFDLMIVEETVFHPIATIAKRLGTPLITLISVVDQQRAKHEQNLPALFTSEPSQFLNIYNSTPPTFLERVELFWELGVFVFKLVPGIMDMMSVHLAREGLSGLTDLDNMTQLYLVNDHPALSFPNLKAPNSIDIAGLGFNKEIPSVIPVNVRHFLDSSKSSGRSVVLVSLGRFGFTSTIVEILINLGLNVINMDHNNNNNNNNNNVLSTTHATENAILSTNQISLFTSSCHNQAKINSVLHTTPILCIPQFADQYFNALLVIRNGFGELVTKEDFTPQLFEEVARRMIDNRDIYVKSQLRAASAVLRSPASPAQQILYFTNHLLEFGDLKYLKNDLILKQGVVQSYNVDVVVVLVFVLFSFIMLVFVGLKKLHNYFGLCNALKKKKLE